MKTPQNDNRCVRMKTLQYLENLLGGVACSMLSLFSVLLGKGDHPEPAKVKRVLCVKFWGIGSLILATPFFREAKRIFPNATIEVLTLSGNRGVVKMLPGVDRVHFLDIGSNVPGAIIAFLKSMFAMRRLRADVFIDLEFYTRASAIMTLFSGSAVRVGYHSQGVWRGNFHTHKIAFNHYRHVTANFYNLLEPFGVAPESNALPPEVVIAASAKGEVDSLLEAHGIGEMFIVVNVNAGELAYERRWAPERFAELTGKLCEKWGLVAVFVGSPGERDYVESVVQAVRPGKGRVLNVAGQLSLDCLGELFSRSSFVLTNDSGPLHLAVAMGARVAAVFGPETPVLYGPVGEGHVTFFADIPCSPCINVERAKRLQCWQPTIRCQDKLTVESLQSLIEKEFSGVMESRA